MPLCNPGGTTRCDGRLAAGNRTPATRPGSPTAVYQRGWRQLASHVPESTDATAQALDLGSGAHGYRPDLWQKLLIRFVPNPRMTTASAAERNDAKAGSLLRRSFPESTLRKRRSGDRRLGHAGPEAAPCGWQRSRTQSSPAPEESYERPPSRAIRG